MKRNLLSNSHFKLLFSKCDNIKNEKRTKPYYSQNEIRLTNLDTGEVYSTKIRQEYSDERTTCSFSNINYMRAHNDKINAPYF